MQVTNGPTAREWLRTWGDKPPESILREAVQGASLCLSIMARDGSPYSAASVDDMREALAVTASALAEHYPNRTGA